jgi:Fur family transcriptional regulator, ferric uptake regulator
VTRDARATRRKSTKQRAAIEEALDRAAGFRSAQELHEELRGTGRRVGLTTVYRALQDLSDAGEVDVLQSAEGEALYRRCRSADHHHHLVCRSCGASVEVEGTEVETWTQRVARRHGFTAVTHTVEVFGVCRPCGVSQRVSRP